MVRLSRKILAHVHMKCLHSILLVKSTTELPKENEFSFAFLQWLSTCAFSYTGDSYFQDKTK